MRISKKTQYGLRAMVYLANPRLKNKICPLKKISKDENIPFHFLEKIFSKLEKANLVKAKKGVQGGYFLAKKPEKTKIGEIIFALEGETPLVKCLKFFCPLEKECLTKNFWQKLNRTINSALNSINLADLIKK
jgi:Rrf2 family protein